MLSRNIGRKPLKQSSIKPEWFSLATQAKAQSKLLLFHNENGFDETINKSASTSAKIKMFHLSVLLDFTALCVNDPPRKCEHFVPNTCNKDTHTRRNFPAISMLIKPSGNEDMITLYKQGRSDFFKIQSSN